MKDLKDKVAIVTGGSSGIGREIALLYASEGAKVVITGRNEEEGEKVVDELTEKGTEALFVKADVADPKASEETVNQAVKQFGGLHIACNNAGIGGPLAPTDEYPLDGWEKVININLSGVFYGMRYQIPALIKSGGGCIVNMASILGAVGAKNSPAYVAAKHGVVGLTKTAALEYADRNLRINSVGPGYIKTPLVTESLGKDALGELVKLHPMGRLGEASEIAEIVLWLSSSKSSFVTGAYYPVDGGYLAQ